MGRPSMLPVAGGDTAGELIGSFFGRLEFRVAGFGEVNKKTVEGTLACWIFSFVPCYCFTLLDAFPDPGYFRVSIVALCAIVATVATFLEVVSFRGTDNGIMTLGSALMLIALTRPDPA